MTWEWVALFISLQASVLAVWWKLQDRKAEVPGIEQLQLDIFALKQEANAQVKLNEEFKKFMSLQKMATGLQHR